MTKWIDKELLERKVILQQAAAGEHLPESAVEKDWWVSMTLKALFRTTCKEYLEFKGGTSLSKGWHLIDRFQKTSMWRSIIDSLFLNSITTIN